MALYHSPEPFCTVQKVNTVKPQWQEHRWLVYCRWFELVFESLGNSSDSSRKQMFRDIFENFSCLIMNIFVVYTHRSDFSEYTQQTIIL